MLSALESALEEIGGLDARIQEIDRARMELLSANVELTTANGSLRDQNEELLIANEESQAAVEEVETLSEEQQASTWKRLTYERDGKLRSAQLDPDRGTCIDRDLSNNQWHDGTDGLAPWRWAERVLAQYQHTLHFLQGLGG